MGPGPSGVVDPVAAMNRSPSASFLGAEFDPFLLAPIGIDAKGMPLSVLSALARLDIDPWQEAAQLARLSAKTATDRLAALIARMPDILTTRLEPGELAGRLVGLLPGRAIPLQQQEPYPAQEGRPDGGADPGNPRRLVLVVVMAFVLALLGFVFSTSSPDKDALAPPVAGESAVAPPAQSAP